MTPRERPVNGCVRLTGDTQPFRNLTCIEQMAGGWIGATDLCPGCTRAFMAALDGIAGPMRWHRDYLDRAKAVTA